MGDGGSLRVQIPLPRLFHRASKSGSTHEPWGCMEQISWSEQVVEYFDQASHGVFKKERRLIANATVKKMGLQWLFIAEFEDKPIGLRLWGCSKCVGWEEWDPRYRVLTS